MEQSYEIPIKGHSNKKERDIFWNHIITEQKASGISAQKFCQQHKIPFSAFRNRRHRLRLKEKQSACGDNEKSTVNVIEQSGFIQVQVADTDKVTNAIVTPKAIEYVETKITFKNGNVMEFSLPAAEYLSEIIARVSRASC